MGTVDVILQKSYYQKPSIKYVTTLDLLISSSCWVSFARSTKGIEEGANIIALASSKSLNTSLGVDPRRVCLRLNLNFSWHCNTVVLYFGKPALVNDAL